MTSKGASGRLEYLLAKLPEGQGAIFQFHPPNVCPPGRAVKAKMNGGDMTKAKTLDVPSMALRDHIQIIEGEQAENLRILYYALDQAGSALGRLKEEPLDGDAERELVAAVNAVVPLRNRIVAAERILQPLVQMDAEA